MAFFLYNNNLFHYQFIDSIVSYLLLFILDKLNTPISRRQTAYYIDDDNDLRLKFLSKFCNNLLLTSFALIPLLSVDSDQYLLDRQKSDLVNQMQACRIEKPKALFAATIFTEIKRHLSKV